MKVYFYTILTKMFHHSEYLFQVPSSIPLLAQTNFGYRNSPSIKEICNSLHSEYCLPTDQIFLYWVNIGIIEKDRKLILDSIRISIASPKDGVYSHLDKLKRMNIMTFPQFKMKYIHHKRSWTS